MESRNELLKFTKKFLGIYRPFGKTFAMAVGMTAIVAALALLPPYLQGRVVDTQKMSLFGKTVLFILLTGLALFATGFVDVARGIFQNKKLDYELDRFSSKLALDKIFDLSIGQHINQNSGIVQSVVTKGKHSMNSLVFTMLFDVLPTLITMLVVGVALLVTAPLLGSIMVAGVMVFAARLAHNNLAIHPSLKELDEREHQFAKQESEVFHHASHVIASAQEKEVTKECDHALGGIQSFAEVLWNAYLKKWIVLNGILAVTWVSASILAAYFVQAGRYTIGFMVMIWWWFFQIQNNASRIGWMLRQVLRLYPPVAKYFELLDVRSDVVVVPNPVMPERFEGRIEFRNVTLRYQMRPCVVDDEDGERIVQPGNLSNEPSLTGVSFVVSPGERVAVVGESGAGKTTIVQALLRAQDPEEGQILIDGHDLRLLDPKHFRKAVGLVEQHVPLFDRSLRYNITFGLGERNKLVAETELADIAKLACMDRFMQNLPNGFDTIIGERGIRLSGGERQRVAIARALIKHPAILIFDEATSNLDPQNELMIREAIERASSGRTTIIVAHRFSTIRNVDKVVVIDKGKVAGIGRHDELARTCPAYQQLVKPQT